MGEETTRILICPDCSQRLRVENPTGPYRVQCSGCGSVLTAGAEERSQDKPLVSAAKANRPSAHAIGLVALLVAHIPMMLSYFRTLWKYEHYQFFPFALGAAGVLVVSRTEWSRVRVSIVAGLLILIDVFLLCSSCVVGSPWLAAAGFVFGLLALCVSSRDLETETWPWEAVLVFLSVVRPPAGYDQQLVQKLQLFTTRIASDLLDRLGIIHVRSGNLIELESKRLFVEEACSGVQSLFAIMFVATLIVAWRRRPPLHTLLLLLAAPLCALPMNVARVLSISLAWDYWQLDWSTGIAHSILGYLLLFVAAGLVVSADKSIRLIGEPISERWAIDRGKRTANPFVRFWNRLWASMPELDPRTPGTGRIFASLCLFASVGMVTWQCRSLFASESLPVSIGQVYAFAELPPAYEGFQFAERETEERSLSANFGQYSETWRYRSGTDEVVIGCDYPFSGWHSLETCYEGIGWDIEEKRIVGNDWPAMAVSLSKPTGEKAFVIYSLFDATTEPVRPRSVDDPIGTVSERVMRRGNWSRTSWSTFQSQVFYVGPASDSSDVRAKLLRIHQESRADLQSHLKSRGLQ